MCLYGAFLLPSVCPLKPSTLCPPPSPTLQSLTLPESSLGSRFLYTYYYYNYNEYFYHYQCEDTRTRPACKYLLLYQNTTNNNTTNTILACVHNRKYKWNFCEQKFGSCFALSCPLEVRPKRFKL